VDGGAVGVGGFVRKGGKLIEMYRDLNWTSEQDGMNGVFWPVFQNRTLKVVVSDGGEWDHVSVSCENRCPNWAEMCFVKELFFEDDETVVQFHPKKSEYVNNHPYCLHLWRKQDGEHELPPSIMVGLKSLGVVI
jgi:hypothetical protein